MRNEKKLAFQSSRISELERQVADLEAENKAISLENEHIKRLLVEKNNSTAALMEKINEMQATYSENIAEVHRLQDCFNDAISKVKSIKSKYEKDAQTLISRIRHRE